MAVHSRAAYNVWIIVAVVSDIKRSPNTYDEMNARGGVVKFRRTVVYVRVRVAGVWSEIGTCNINQCTGENERQHPCALTVRNIVVISSVDETRA